MSNSKNLPMDPSAPKAETHDQARRRLANELRYLLQQVNAKIVELTKEHDAKVIMNLTQGPAGANQLVNRTFGMTEVRYTPATKHY